MLARSVGMSPGRGRALAAARGDRPGRQGRRVLRPALRQQRPAGAQADPAPARHEQRDRAPLAGLRARNRPRAARHEPRARGPRRAGDGRQPRHRPGDRGGAGARGRPGGDRQPLARRSSRRRRPRSATAATPFVADASDLDRLAALPGEVEEALGPIEILVANTGGPPFGGALDHELDEWESAYRSLVLAPRVLAGAVVPGMRERGWGRIVNVGSSSTREPIPGLNLSNAHRMAAVGFLKTLSREVAADGITVNTVATGRFATERLADAGGSLDGAEEAAKQRSPRRPPRPPRGVRRPRRLPLLRARRLHHRHRHPDRRRPRSRLGLLAVEASRTASAHRGEEDHVAQVLEPARIIVRRSMPMPEPPAGSIPYSSARTNSSSCGWGVLLAPGLLALALVDEVLALLDPGR